MNLRTAKTIKYAFDTVLPISIFSLGALAALVNIGISTNGVALIILAVVAAIVGVVMFFVWLYEKAVRTVKQIEEGDEEGGDDDDDDYYSVNQGYYR